MPDFDLGQTYFYKLHMLTNEVNSLFDQVLRSNTQVGLSQFMLLVSVQQHQPVLHKEIAKFLAISPAAISRQVELARKAGWIDIAEADDRRKQFLKVTSLGNREIGHGMGALEKHALHVFDGEDTKTTLMKHLDMLLQNARTK